MLPPDIRAKAAQRPSGGGGIGGGAHENAVTAKQREAAMNPDAVREEEAAAPAAAVDTDLKVCPNARCNKELVQDWNFCSHCGADLLRGGPEKRLGIAWSEEEMHDYIFKGYVVKDLTILGKHKITVKSSQANDMDEIDDYMMNGSWAKHSDGTPRKVSEFYLRQMNSCCVTAASVLKFNGSSIGETLAARVEYLMERGSSFVDIIGQRVVMFNQALGEHLKKADSILGS